MVSIDLGQPSGGQDFRHNLVEALNNQDPPVIRFRAGFAYATYSGVTQLLASLGNNSTWNSISKFWLLGVHNGITDLGAIKLLTALPNSRVRLATCGLGMRQAVEGQRVFHAKTIALDPGAQHTISTLIAGSANLTGSAFGAHARNYEVGIAWRSPLEGLVSEAYDSWWKGAWASGVNANSTNVRSYADNRTKFRIRNPDVAPDDIQDEFNWAASAQTLWLEAGAMSTGGSHNAIDLNSNVVSFFGPVSNQTRKIILIADDKRWVERPLTPKETTFNVELWRLSLPTKRMGGFDYKNRIVHFTKLESGGNPLEFRLDVADADSAEAQNWQLNSGRHGTIGSTGGGHSFGFM